MTNGFDVLAQTIITSNLILVQGLGLYALVNYTKDMKSAVKNGLTTSVAMVMAGVLVWLLGDFLPVSPSAQVGVYLVIGVVASCLSGGIFDSRLCSQEVMFNSALVGFLFLLAQDGIVGANNLWLALGAGVGYFLVLVLMVTLRQRLELAPIPKSLRGTPIMLITAGLVAIALLGFRF